MIDDIAKKARDAIALWEMNPRRQALAKLLGVPASQITDEMLKRGGKGWNIKDPPMQQIPRRK